MDYISKYKNQLLLRIFSGLIIVITAVVGSAFLGIYVLSLDNIYVFILVASVAVSFSLVLSQILALSFAKPVEILTQAVNYSAHNNKDIDAPDLQKNHIAKDLVQAMTAEIYSLASSSSSSANTPNISTQGVATNIDNIFQKLLDIMRIPTIGIDANQNVTFINVAGCEYIGLNADQIIGKPLYDSYNFSFQSDLSFEDWLKETRQNSVTGSHSWERVKLSTSLETVKQFDLSASFSGQSSTGTEVIVSLFDKTNRYNQDDQEISFVALAVHELRTPLTIMRGYIEVFEDELGPNLNPELTEFMHKMHASAQQLAAFVSNILNVARVEENQLALKLRSEDWPAIIKNAAADLELRARVHGMHIELQIADNIPLAAIDRISSHEIINNLVDNAIKYSGDSEKIILSAGMNDQGLIETSIQDFGVGIPESVVGELFQKFYRSHKSKVQVGGTGLGLYLCKALVQAHGGNIWVRSKEGEGSIFSFTLLPYDQLSKEEIESEDGIIRGAHGWIKNHSLYRN